MHLFLALADMLACSLASGTMYVLSFMSACIWFRFKTGPGRCTGRAGPHIQPRDWLGLAQCQWDTCRRCPGHMKANTVSSSLPSSSTSVILHPPPLPCPSTLHSHPPHHHRDAGRTRDVGGEAGINTQFCLPVVFYFLLKEKNSPSVPLPFFPQPTPFCLLLAVRLWASICHCYIQDCLLHESKWVWGHQWGCGGLGGMRQVDKVCWQELKRRRLIHPAVVMVQLAFLL